MDAEPPAGWEHRGEEGADAGLSTQGASQTRLAETAPAKDAIELLDQPLARSLVMPSC
jgi:hypothetical protein